MGRPCHAYCKYAIRVTASRLVSFIRDFTLSSSHTLSEYETLCRSFGVTDEMEGRVVIGRDTRESGPELLRALIDGIKAAKGQLHDYGLF